VSTPGRSTLALLTAFALLGFCVTLVPAATPGAEAAVHGISAADLSLTAGPVETPLVANRYTTITVDADETLGSGSADVLVLVTAGGFLDAQCDDDAADGQPPVACALSAGSVGTNTSNEIAIDSAAPGPAGGTDVILVTYHCPDTGPVDPQVTAIQPDTVRTLTLTCAARAATIAVTTTDDELNADGDCSLREAIQAA
jgi:CSLREA domain-containing protein